MRKKHEAKSNKPILPFRKYSSERRWISSDPIMENEA